MAQRRLLVIGGVAAGMTAASKARRLDPDLEIVVFERGDWISYSACGLPYFVGDLITDTKPLLARSVDEFAKNNIDVRLRHEVRAIHPDRHTITVQPHNASPVEERYDALLLATGATPNIPPIQGLDLNGVFSLYTMTDALRMRAFIKQHQPRKAVVVGGGYIGLEMAENLVRRGMSIQLVQRPNQLFSSVDSDIAELIDAELARHGVDVSFGHSVVSACAGEDGRVSCVETDHGSIDADLVLLATGIRPQVALAEQAGLRIGATGAIAVDDHQRTSDPAIYAAGDCAEHFHLLTHTPYWVPLGTTANKQGRVAGENIAGGDIRFHGIVGTAIARSFDLEIGRTGLSMEEANRLRFDAVSTYVDYTDIAGYYPGAGPLRVKLVAERGSGRLLGGQAAGVGGVDKRIDVLATALYAGMNLEQLSALDLEYAPPFNSVWDPILVAATQLQKKI